MFLRTPLTPFTGLFYNIIHDPLHSQNDLALLEDFVTSLEPSSKLSEGVDKFHRLCAIYVRVAQAYVQVKSKQQNAMNESGTAFPFSAAGSHAHHPEKSPNQMDDLLSTQWLSDFNASTGMFANDQTPSDILETESREYDMSSRPADWSVPPDWYMGNVSFYGLLEQDVSSLTGMNFPTFSGSDDNT